MNDIKERIKLHWKEHKTVYISWIAVLGGIVIGSQLNKRPTIQIEAGENVAFGSNNTISTNLIRRGHPGDIIVHDQTGVAYPSQSYAAQQLGLNQGAISKQLNGHMNHVKGNTFTYVKEAV